MQPNNSNNNNNKPNHHDMESAVPTMICCTLYTLSARAGTLCRCLGSFDLIVYEFVICLPLIIIILFFVCRKYICVREPSPPNGSVLQCEKRYPDSHITIVDVKL